VRSIQLQTGGEGKMNEFQNNWREKETDEIPQPFDWGCVAFYACIGLLAIIVLSAIFA
jgi:hypothetical protein